MVLDDAAYNRETEARTISALPIAAPESLEDKLAFVFRDPRPLVGNANATALFDRDLHRRAASRVADGIFRKVANGAPDHLGVALNDHRTVDPPERNLLLVGER